MTTPPAGAPQPAQPESTALPTVSAAAPLVSRVSSVLRTVPDFPKPGIQFRDITPLLADAALMREVITAMCEPFAAAGVSRIVGIESRGFLFGVPAALAMNVAFVPARKPGKLPRPVVREAFSLEYGSDALEVHADAIAPGDRVLIVDDILATGGTLAATCRIVERMGGGVVGISVLGEIAGLCEPSLLARYKVSALLSF